MPAHGASPCLAARVYEHNGAPLGEQPFDVGGNRRKVCFGDGLKIDRGVLDDVDGAFRVVVIQPVLQ